MRFIVIGAGAVGVVVGGRLAEHGHDVLFVARGEHGAAIAQGGLEVASPDRTVSVTVPVVDSPQTVPYGPDDVVLVAVKSQDSVAVLDALAAVAPADLPIVCLQNGVHNEREALRRFERVYGATVMCPTVHLAPGRVIAHSAPITGVIDVGRYPTGVDDIARATAAALSASDFDSVAQPDIVRWKWRKLITNLGNAIEAVCGPAARSGPIGDIVRAEAETVLDAAGIDPVSVDDDAVRRGDLLRLQRVGGELRPGGSSWQSLARGVGTIETDYLNGEIVLLGRLHAVPTPANAALQAHARRMARSGTPPGSVSPDDLLASLRDL